MMGQRMTWDEIKKAYPKQVVGLVDCQPDDINFKTAVVKCTDKTMPYATMDLMAVDGEIFMISTELDDDDRLVL